MKYLERIQKSISAWGEYQGTGLLPSHVYYGVVNQLPPSEHFEVVREFGRPDYMAVALAIGSSDVWRNKTPEFINDLREHSYERLCQILGYENFEVLLDVATASQTIKPAQHETSFINPNDFARDVKAGQECLWDICCEHAKTLEGLIPELVEHAAKLKFSRV